MRARTWCQAGFVTPWFIFAVAAPAHAGWGTDYTRAVMGSLARQAARQVIIYELRKLNSRPLASRTPSAGGYRPNGYTDRPNTGGNAWQYAPSQTPSHSYSSSSKSASSANRSTGSGDESASGLRYPTDKHFVPPPPPTEPLLYPPSHLTANNKSKAPVGASPLVPPPPPAPSVWDDTAASDQAPIIGKR